MRETPQSGQIYRHYKGRHFKVIRVSCNYPYPLTLGQRLHFYSADGRIDFIAASPIQRGDTVVFYESTSGSIQAHPLATFLEVLSDPGKGTQLYRFELVGEDAA